MQRCCLRIRSSVPSTNAAVQRSRSLFSARDRCLFLSTNTATPPINTKRIRSIKPRAANPTAYATAFFNPDAYHRGDFKFYAGFQHRSSRHTENRWASRKPTQKPKISKTANKWKPLGDHLQDLADKKTVIPRSAWVKVIGISPVGSLESTVEGIDKHLNMAETQGIVDLDHQWKDGEPIPFLPQMITAENRPKWIRRARLLLSPSARPRGWLLQFDNRSIAYALLNSEKAVCFAHRPVILKECAEEPSTEDETDTAPVLDDANLFLDPTIGDATVRIENAPRRASVPSLFNFLSRFDIHTIDSWKKRATDGYAPHPTYIVQCHDASWARAIVREKQNDSLRLRDDSSPPVPLRLVQFPKQMW